MPIDPVAVREQRKKLDTRNSAAVKGIRAADALLWGAEYVKDQPALNVLRIDVSVIASATPGADIVQRYVKESAHSFAEDILDRAFEMAKLDFDNANKSTQDNQ